MRKALGSHVRGNVVGYVALFIALGGTTYAAAGGNFILGKSNTANKQTSLAASPAFAGRTLQLTNASTGAGATALGLHVGSGRPPLTVNSGKKVAHLNADELDGIDSSQLEGARAYALSGGSLCPGTPVSFCTIDRGKGVAYVVNVGQGIYCVGVNDINAAGPKSVALLSAEWSRTNVDAQPRTKASWRSQNVACASQEFEVLTTRLESTSVRTQDNTCCVQVSGLGTLDNHIAFTIAIP